MSDIRFNRWLHQSGTGGIYQDADGNIGIGTSVPRSALDVQSGFISVGENVLSASGVSTFTTVNATTLTGNLTGNVTGNLTGNLTGNVTGNLTGNVTGNLTGNVTGSLTVGDKFISSSGVGIGTTNVTGRDAGISTAVGTLIFNSESPGGGQLEVYTSNDWRGISMGQKYQPLSITGGSVDTSGRPGWYVHTFTGPGSLEVLGGSGGPYTIEYVVIAGGGASGSFHPSAHEFGGGGAGGYRASTSYAITPGTIPVSIGGGGAQNPGGSDGSPGTHTSFGPIISSGGGGGGSSQRGGRPGGSGGGGSHNPGTSGGGAGNQWNPGAPGFPGPSPPQGNNGGSGGANPNHGGGGGGAGGAGSNYNQGGSGGSAQSNSITGSSVPYAGGGGGAPSNSPAGGAYGKGGTSANGDDGVVIIAYPESIL